MNKDIGDSLVLWFIPGCIFSIILGAAIGISLSASSIENGNTSNSSCEPKIEYRDREVLNDNIQCGIKWGDGKQTNENYKCDSIISILNEKETLKSENSTLKLRPISCEVPADPLCENAQSLKCGIKWGDGTETNDRYNCDSIINLITKAENTTNNRGLDNLLKIRQMESLELQNRANQQYLNNNQPLFEE